MIIVCTAWSGDSVGVDARLSLCDGPAINWWLVLGAELQICWRTWKLTESIDCFGNLRFSIRIARETEGSVWVAEATNDLWHIELFSTFWILDREDCEWHTGQFIHSLTFFCEWESFWGEWMNLLSFWNLNPPDCGEKKILTSAELSYTATEQALWTVTSSRCNTLSREERPRWVTSSPRSLHRRICHRRNLTVLAREPRHRLWPCPISVTSSKGSHPSCEVIWQSGS